MFDTLHTSPCSLPRQAKSNEGSCVAQRKTSGNTRCLTVVVSRLSNTQWVTFLIGSGNSSVVESRTRDRKVSGSSPGRSWGRIILSRVNFLCWFLLRYPFHPRVTTVARKRSRSFFQTRRWQVTAKHVCTLRIWLSWSGMVHGCMVYTERAEAAAVSCGTSHVST